MAAFSLEELVSSLPSAAQFEFDLSELDDETEILSPEAGNLRTFAKHPLTLRASLGRQDRERFDASLRQARDTGSAWLWSGVAEIDGESRTLWVVGHLESIARARGRVRGFIADLSPAGSLWEGEDLLHLALEGTSDGLWDWNLKTNRVYFSDTWARMLGFEPGELEPDISTWEALAHPEDMSCAQAAIEDHLRGRVDRYQCEHRVRTKSGGWKWVLDRGRIVERDETGEPLRMVGTHVDITRRKELEQELVESEDTIRSLYRIAGSQDLGFAGQVAELLALGTRRFGLEIGILARIEDQQYEVVQSSTPLDLGVARGERFDLEQTYSASVLQVPGPFTLPNGSSSTVASHPARATLRLESYLGTRVMTGGKVFGTLSFSSTTPRNREFRAADLEALQLMASWLGSELRQLEIEEELRSARDHLDQLSQIDSLTQLLNRRGFERKLERVAQRARFGNCESLVLLIDLDDFKAVNDRFGHAAGDDVLRQTAQAIEQALRPTDLIARVGGDEFVALLPETDRFHALEIAERVRCAVAEHNRGARADTPRATVSVAVADHNPDARTVSDILRSASATLREAKRTGKNRVAK